jgi:hypothetical protein
MVEWRAAAVTGKGQMEQPPITPGDHRVRKPSAVGRGNAISRVGPVGEKRGARGAVGAGGVPADPKANLRRPLAPL